MPAAPDIPPDKPPASAPARALYWLTVPGGAAENPDFRARRGGLRLRLRLSLLLYRLRRDLSRHEEGCEMWAHARIAGG